MRKLSLQWRLTILTTVLITVLCGCLTFFLYKNGVYYIDTLRKQLQIREKHRKHYTLRFRIMSGTILHHNLLRRCIIRNPIIETEVY